MCLCALQLRHRDGRLVPCVATVRWHWVTDRITIAVRFWPVAEMLGGRPMLEETAAVADEVRPSLNLG